MCRRIITSVLLTAALLVVAVACSTAGHTPKSKLKELSRNQTPVNISLSGEQPSMTSGVIPSHADRDTIIVKDLDGGDLILMKAVFDSTSGEMVANEELDAAVITARFSNVAERHGKVDLQFDITVPKSMRDPAWQLRFNPVMYLLGEEHHLDSVIITGSAYRHKQKRGYELYSRFINGIITDRNRLVDIDQLTKFIERNLPEIYAFRLDSNFVSEDRFYSYYGVNEKMAIDHYTRKLAMWHNRNIERRKGQMWNRYVKAPYIDNGIRLDTVLTNDAGDFVYCYTQTIETRPKLRRVDIVVSGSIYDQDVRLYSFPKSDSLTFYISSVSSFVDDSDHYMRRVVSRRASANTSYHIEFEVNRADVNLSLADNAVEMDRIQDNINDLLANEVFDLDSIVVTATASPDGRWKSNASLTQRRSESVSRYMDQYIRGRRRDMELSLGYLINLDGEIERPQVADIPFISRGIPEDWETLSWLVERDDTLTDSQKSDYRSLLDISDYDRREAMLSQQSSYKYVKEKFYPRLRSVRFNFFLHRKGMVQDTVVTTELDTAYMKGVEAIKERDYETAVIYLAPYQDYNTAIAYVSLDRNQSALEILEREEQTVEVKYMLAIVYARLGRIQEAVTLYMQCCQADYKYVGRGNLDPEISVLIKRYGLNRDEYEVEY